MDKARVLRKLIEQTGLKLKAFAEKAGIPYTTLYSILERGVGKASVDNVIKICKALGISVEEMERLAASYNDKTGFFSATETADYKDLVFLPIVGSISCGKGCYAYEEVEGYEPVPREWLNGEEHFFLRAKGDSMVGVRIYEGDLLLIRKQPAVDDGEIAVVLINDEAYLKRVYYRDDKLILQSENPKYPPIIADTSETIIIGKLIMNVIKY